MRNFFFGKSQIKKILGDGLRKMSKSYFWTQVGQESVLSFKKKANHEKAYKCSKKKKKKEKKAFWIGLR